ncbi:MAG: ribonuclease HI family protein [Chitinophagaceae bacterium]|nr:ribonuclease HI family protein [Oligoflexus sp.]
MDKVWDLYFDGSSFDKGRRGGPGPSAGAAVLVDSDGLHAPTIMTVFLPRSDSDSAEYQGLICGLEGALAAGISRIAIRGDSRNVIDHLTGRKAVRKASLVLLNEIAKTRLAEFDEWAIEWIPRAQNGRADKAARMCIERAS